MVDQVIILSFASVFMLALVSTSHTATVNKEWMKHSLETIFSHSRHHKTGPNEKTAARNFIKARFKEDGLTIYSDVFSTLLPEVMGENIIGLLPGSKFNTSSDIIYAIGAHYDTMPNTPVLLPFRGGGFRIPMILMALLAERTVPGRVFEGRKAKGEEFDKAARSLRHDLKARFGIHGVDDNGSGVVAMLEAARILSGSKDRQYSILFIAFDFEEWEYPGPDTACGEISCGSKKFVKEWLSSAESKAQGTFGGIIVMDTVLNYNKTDRSQKVPDIFQHAFPKSYKEIENDDFEGDFYFVTSRPFDATLSKAFINSWTGIGNEDFEIFHLNLTQVQNPPTQSDEYIYGNLFRSDHASFWKKKLPAIFISDTADFRGYMAQCYHQACDKIEHVDADDMEFLGKLTAALVSSMNKLTAKPTPNVINSASCFQSGISVVVGIMLLWIVKIN